MMSNGASWFDLLTLLDLSHDMVMMVCVYGNASVASCLVYAARFVF